MSELFADVLFNKLYLISHLLLFFLSLSASQPIVGLYSQPLVGV